MTLNPTTSNAAPTSSILVLPALRQMHDKFVSLFQNILADQTSVTPITAVIKSDWAEDNIQAFKAIEREFRQIKQPEQNSSAEYLTAFENLVYRLSAVVKIQLGKLAIVLPKNVDISSLNYVFPNVSITTIPKDEGFFSFLSSPLKCFVCYGGNVTLNGQELQTADSNIVKAVGIINEICLEVFGQHFAKNEGPQAAVALVKMSNDSSKLQKKCHEKLKSILS